MEVLIQRWLKGSQNFTIGKNLYLTLGTDKKLKELFNSGETPFAKKALKDALEQLLITEKSNKISVQPKILEVMPQGNDSVLHSIEIKWKKLYAEMNMLRYQLDKYANDNSEAARINCKTICTDILDLEEAINKLWNKRDSYLETGKLPEVIVKKFVIPTDPVKLAKLISSIQKNIRRNKLNASLHPDKPHYEALVKEYEEQLKQINDQQKN